MTTPREYGEHQPDFGTGEGKDAYNERIKAEQKKRREDEEKTEQDQANQAGRDVLKRLNLDTGLNKTKTKKSEPEQPNMFDK